MIVQPSPLCLVCRSDLRFFTQVSFVSVVCRSSDSSIQAARLIAACDLAPYCQRIASAFSPGHDSPSNDRFSPHAGIPRMENNTLELQLLSESCRALAISNVQTAILRWIPSVSGIFTRFPCSANKHACPISRVAHLPQKPWYVILGTIAVVSCESSFAKLAFFGKRCIRSFHCFLRKQGQLHLQSVSAIQPSLTLAFIVNLCI